MAIQKQGSSLVMKLSEIMAEIDRLPKRGRNDFHKYDYVLESDLVDAVRGKMAARRVFLFQSVEDERRDGDITTLQMKFTFVDGETDERFEIGWVGQGQDKNDKGAAKAATSALKYCLLKHFQVPTGEDPDADGPKKGQRRTEGQKGPLQADYSQQGTSNQGPVERREKGAPSGLVSSNAQQNRLQSTPERSLEKVASEKEKAELFSFAKRLGYDPKNKTQDKNALQEMLKAATGRTGTDGITLGELKMWQKEIQATVDGGKSAKAN